MGRKLLNRFLLIFACLVFAASYLYPLKPQPLSDVARKHLTKKDPKIEAILDKAAAVPIPDQWGIIKNDVNDQGLDLRDYFSGIDLRGRFDSAEKANQAILNYLQRKASPKITLGLDLKGGTSFLVKLDARGLEGQQLKTAQDQAIEIIRKRIDRFGVSEPIIQPVGSDRINVQIPGLSEQQRLEARSQIEKVAKLEFRLVHPQSEQYIAENRVPPGYERKIQKIYDDKTGKYESHPLLVTVRSDLTGKSLTKAFVTRDSLGMIAIGFELDKQGSDRFALITRENVGNRLAIVLDGEVKSAPVINGEIPGGRGEITGGAGGFSPEEAFELAGVLNNPLQTPVSILAVQGVEPTLGSDSVAGGIRAGLLAIALIAVFMAVYYLRAGLIADLALCANILLLIGILATFNFTLTMPGIAGLVLTIGIAVDANVLVFERIREHLRKGQDVRLAVREGFGHAFGTIIDSNMTTLITALVLTWTGSGPVQGFGVVLSVGICTSVFAALVISRFLFDLCLYKFEWQKLTMLSMIGQTNFSFLRWRWPAAVLSIVVITMGMFSILHKGKGCLGVDFAGGDALVLGYKQKVDVAGIRASLEKVGSRDNVIQYQSNDQLIVKTQYEKGEKAFEQLRADHAEAGFSSLSIERVGPTVGKELTYTALLSLAIASVAIMIYISARFEFAYAVGAVVALLHDVLVTLGLYVLSGREITLPAVGALLTIAGYSLNDTVVVYDRIREEVKLKGERMDFASLINLSVNEVLGRTLLTSLTTLIASFCLLWFGGGAINDFAYILVVGVISGTYSSVYIAAPILLFWHPSHLKPREDAVRAPAGVEA